MYKCVLFDMDGTLVNTFEGIHNSYKYAFEKMNLKFPGEVFVGKAIGAPLLSVFQETLGLSLEEATLAVDYYREYYSKHGKNEVSVYDGLEDSLKLLKEKGFLLGVATLKRENFAIDILNNLGFSKYFDVIYGIDDKDHLTKAQLLDKCMFHLKCAPCDTILVGDSEYDAEGAEKMGVDFMAVKYGFGFQTEDSLTKSKVDFVVESAYEIAKTIIK